MEHRPIKPWRAAPLALPTTPIQGESLPGLLARATRRNVLARTDVVLRDVGLVLPRQGLISLQAGDWPADFSRKIRCGIEQVEARRTPYLDEGRSMVRWGDHAIRRDHLDFVRRRVSPAALAADRPHHRMNWLNLLLPVCPESLEPLVDTCSSCGRVQGWHHAWGIGICDDLHCGEPLRSSPKGLLPAYLADGYRQFAAFLSPAAADRASATATWTEEMRTLPDWQLVNLALIAGSAFLEPELGGSVAAIRALPPLRFAAVAATGMPLLSQWPSKLREASATHVATFPPSATQAMRAFTSSMRQLGDAAGGRDAVAAFVRRTFPDPFAHISMALGDASGPVVARWEACRRIGLKMHQLRSIESAGLLTQRFAHVGRREFGQLDAEEVARLTTAWRGSEPAAALAWRLGVPHYAVEQLACLGIVDREDDPAVVHLDDRLRLRSESVEVFVEALAKAARTDPPPGHAAPLGSAMRVFGGSPKPWGAVLERLISARLPFWLVGSGGEFARRARVRPEELRRLRHLTFRQSDFPLFPFAQTCPQADVIELLNVAPKHVLRAAKEGMISFERSGQQLRADRTAVLDLAQRYIAWAEIAARSGIPSTQAWRQPNMPAGPLGPLREDAERRLGLRSRISAGREPGHRHPEV